MHTYVVAEDCGGMGHEEPLKGGFQITPNPFSDLINVTFSGIPPQSWALFDMLGRKLGEGRIQSTFERIYTSGIPSGVYTLLLNYGGENRVQRLLK